MGRAAVPITRAVKRVQNQVARWRRLRSPGTRMPERLWRAAVEAARSHGVSAVARAAQLAYYSLKRRLEVPVGKLEPAQSFVEVAVSPMPTLGSREHVVSMELTGGVQVRVVTSDADLVLRLTDSILRESGR